MKFSACAAILLSLALLPTLVMADDTSGTTASDQQTQPGMLDSVDQIAKSLGVPSLVLGGFYAQGTFKLTATNAKSELTDNGRPSPILDFVTPEHVVYKFPMKYGYGVWGFNFVGSFGQVDTTYQNQPGSSAIIGQNIGTDVRGDYLAAAPFIYLRLGPVNPNSDTYWLFGYGLGAGLMHVSGNPIMYTFSGTNNTATATAFPLSSRSAFYLYQTWRWQFHFGHWDIRFEGRILDHHKINGYNASYENYGLGLAYTIRF